jgi:hypothetical protein
MSPRKHLYYFNMLHSEEEIGRQAREAGCKTSIRRDSYESYG